MGRSHPHHHSEGNIKVAFFLNLFFSVIELVGGLLTNSVAILSDALHDLGDSFTLGISWYFERLSTRSSTAKFSYGYKRFSVLGALINAIILIVGSVVILLEAIPRLFHPVQPETEGMIYLAIGGVVVNGFAAFRLSKGHSINEKVVYLHLLEDILGWVAVLIGAIVMHYTELPIIDPILSVMIAGFIIFNVIRNLKESFRIILQGTPSNIDLNEIHNTLNGIPTIKGFHDCHAWTMDGRFHILSVHLEVSESSDMKDLEMLKREVKAKLKTHGIDHVTIEFESENEECDPC
ncbi:MAG: cation diffusion facilitator family transporter [Ekhidna sp.]